MRADSGTKSEDCSQQTVASIGDSYLQNPCPFRFGLLGQCRANLNGKLVVE